MLLQLLLCFMEIPDTLEIEKLQDKALRYSMLDFKSSYKQQLHNCGKSTLFLQRLQKLMEVVYRIGPTKWIVIHHT